METPDIQPEQNVSLTKKLDCRYNTDNHFEEIYSYIIWQKKWTSYKNFGKNYKKSCFFCCKIKKSLLAGPEGIFH